MKFCAVSSLIYFRGNSFNCASIYAHIISRATIEMVETTHIGGNNNVARLLRHNYPYDNCNGPCTMSEILNHITIEN